MRKQRLLSLFVLLIFCVSMISSCTKNKSKTLNNEAYDLGIQALDIADMHPKVLNRIDIGSLSDAGKAQVKEALREEDYGELLAISNKLDEIYEAEDSNNSNKATYTLCLSSYVLLLSFEVQSGTPETIIEKRNLVAEALEVEKISSEIVSGTTSKAQTNTAATTTTNSITATAGQINAVKQAQSYLSISAFSHDGLVEQLEYEKFTNAQAVYGADNCGANWNEQAAKSAQSYLDISSFSRSGLIEQLEYEGFTSAQAEYGVDNCGANW